MDATATQPAAGKPAGKRNLKSGRKAPPSSKAGRKALPSSKAGRKATELAVRIQREPDTGRRGAMVEELLAATEHLVRSRVTKFCRLRQGARRHEDDLCSAGTIAVWKSIAGFRAEKGAWSTYVVPRIEVAVRREYARRFVIAVPYRYHGDAKYRPKTFVRPAMPKIKKIPDLSEIPDPASIGRRLPLADEAGLNESECMSINLTLQGYSNQEIAASMRIAEWSVKEVKNRAYKKIRAASAAGRGQPGR